MKQVYTMLFCLSDTSPDEDDAAALDEVRSAAMLAKPKFEEARLRFKTASRFCPEVTIHFASKCMNRLDLLTWKTSKSSAFFRFFELCHHCPRLRRLKVNKSVHLCEAPGNFIDACLWLYGPAVDWHAMSLRTVRSTQFYAHHLESQRANGRMRIHTGDDGTGNVGCQSNVRRFWYDVGAATVDLVTADGNVIHKDNEESENAKLVAAEIVCASALLRPGGSLVLRVFDTDKPPTVNMVWLLIYMFERVDIARLEITDVGASDRYLVCSGMRPRTGALAQHIADLSKFAYDDDQFVFEMSVNRPSLGAEIRFYRSVVDISHHNQQVMEQARALAVYLESIGITTPTTVAQHIKAKLVTSVNYNTQADDFLQEFSYI